MKPRKNNTDKAIIFDASTLISLAINGLFEEIKSLKKIFKGHFIITEGVKEEIIDRPINTKRFELEALKLQKLLDEKTLELPESLGIKKEEIASKTKELMEIANSTFVAKGNYIHIVDYGEMSCLSLSKILNERKIENILAIDERTARLLVESPGNLKNLFESKLHTKIKTDVKKYDYFKGLKIIRSSELVYVAYKKGIIKLKGPKVLDALLYAVKFKGASISDSEIEEIKKI